MAQKSKGYTHSQFDRLVNVQTKSSLVRRIATKLPSMPLDALDLVLASNYDHHSIWGAPKAYVVKQERSCVEEHGLNVAGLSDREDITAQDMNGSIRKESKGSYRNAAFHVELGIPPHHTSNSRRGYGRSQDGCFYST